MIDMKKTLLTLMISFFSAILINAQYEIPDSTALEDVIVEVYYVSDSLDYSDEDGGALEYCSVTYRVFVDLKPGYEIQAVYGNENNLLQISTTTEFFNNEDRGDETGDGVGDNYLGDNTVALDSWLTMGPASEAHFGVLKSSDDDGSIVGGDNNDGGSEGVDGGLLNNDQDEVGILLTESDGLVEGEVPSLTLVGLDVPMFGDENSSETFESNGGAYSVLEGVSGINEENQILIGQFTTTGELSFRLNIQIGIPDSLICGDPNCHNTIQYVAELHPDNALPGVENDNIFQRDELNFTSSLITCESDSTDSVDEIEFLLNNIEMYPNPAIDEIRFQVPFGTNNPTEIFIYNNLGELCKTDVILPMEVSKELNVKSLNSGFYNVVLRTNEVQVSKQIIVQ